MDAGLFGGTFNPIHNGHLGIIEFVKQDCHLDRIYLFPSGTPPHKPKQNLAPATVRYEMVKASIAAIPDLFCSDIEIRRQGPSFTIDTVEAFCSTFGRELNFHLLMGSDAFFDIATWKEKDRIFRTVPIIVMLRGEGLDQKALASFIDEHIAKGYKSEAQGFSHPELFPIRISKVPRIDISSTLIRDRIKAGQSVSGLVPAPVEAIIKKKDLYT